MKARLIFCLAVFAASNLFVSCGSGTAKGPAPMDTKPVVAVAQRPVVATEVPDSADADVADETMTAWVLVADTGRNYFSLRSRMLQLREELQLKIDTMGRGWNQKKKLIALPEDSDDEIYAGEYFPRRVPTPTLSLEYLYCYKPNAAPKTMALVAGIYESKSSADSALRRLQAKQASAYSIRSEIYMGCMH
jgi:hypothetical protein